MEQAIQMKVCRLEKEQSASNISHNLTRSEMRGGYRDRCFDIAKGIGIILVVCGHARAPFNHFLSLFHMALFFMISGYLYNDNRAGDFQSVKGYIVKKLKSLWIPYFVSNLFFILLNNFFIKVGIYSTNPEFLEIVTGSRNELARVFELKDYFVEIIKAFFMLDNAQLGGALWFLRSLFIIAVGHNILVWLTEKIKHKNVVFIVLLVLCAGLAVAMNDIDKLVPEWENSGLIKVVVKAGRQIFAPYLAYVLGITAKRVNLNTHLQKNKITVGISSFLLLLILNQFGRIDLSMGLITNLVFFAVVSILGYMMVISFCYCIEKTMPVSVLLEYLGKHTMCIIVLHLLSFKAISYIYLYITNSESMLLASFPVLDNTTRFLWVAYSVVGIAFPIALYQIYGVFRRVAKSIILKIC